MAEALPDPVDPEARPTNIAAGAAPRFGNWPIARPRETLAALTPPAEAAPPAAGTGRVDSQPLSDKIAWNAPSDCVPPKLKQVLAEAAEKFGPMVVWSTHRPAGQNRRAGGARESYHLDCRAIDFRPTQASNLDVVRYMRGRIDVGGWNIYRSGLIHIDDGPRRTW
jgi:hypothetical protein